MAPVSSRPSARAVASEVDSPPSPLTDLKAAAARGRRIEARRTIIPVLLTTGVLCLALAVVPRVVDPFSPLARAPAVLSLALAAMGLLLFGVGVLNMLQVRALLARREQ